MMRLGAATNMVSREREARAGSSCAGRRRRRDKVAPARRIIWVLLIVWIGRHNIEASSLGGMVRNAC
ncbi:hypothetical protein BBJK_00021 [Bifidobacterium bifidum LMG 13195]|uniref:Uncharacterized protein n=1 Tax=Bifidobacterium bifidum LMG 13195 TaxID=1207542 RepID=A0A286TA14_BIFBI|nr:hypothetical protein BBJK_00021 [Bifidobacterium bifidum LMG 13195]